MSDLIPGVTPAHAVTQVVRGVDVVPGGKPATQLHRDIVDNIHAAFPYIRREDAEDLARFTLDYARISVFNLLTEAADAVGQITHPDPVTNAIGEDLLHVARRTVCAHRDRFNRINQLPPAPERQHTQGDRATA